MTLPEFCFRKSCLARDGGSSAIHAVRKEAEAEGLPQVQSQSGLCSEFWAIQGQSETIFHRQANNYENGYMDAYVDWVTTLPCSICHILLGSETGRISIFLKKAHYPVRKNEPENQPNKNGQSYGRMTQNTCHSQCQDAIWVINHAAFI